MIPIKFIEQKTRWLEDVYVYSRLVHKKDAAKSQTDADVLKMENFLLLEALNFGVSITKTQTFI